MKFAIQAWLLALFISLAAATPIAVIPPGSCATASGSVGTIMCCLFGFPTPGTGTLASVCANANVSKKGVASCPTGYTSVNPICCKPGGIIGPPNYQYNIAYDCATYPK